MKNPAINSDHVTKTRKLFIELLRRAFPGTSETAIAIRAAPVLGVSERQVRNWLRGEHSPAAQHFLAVAAIAGAELVITARRPQKCPAGSTTSSPASSRNKRTARLIGET